MANNFTDAQILASINSFAGPIADYHPPVSGDGGSQAQQFADEKAFWDRVVAVHPNAGVVAHATLRSAVAVKKAASKGIVLNETGVGQHYSGQ